jgi:isopentenyl-diphosphate delta-isomerase
LDVARAVVMGASAAGIAGGVLKAASSGYAETQTELEQLIYEFKVAMFLTGSRTIDEMRKARYVIQGETRAWLDR